MGSQTVQDAGPLAQATDDACMARDRVKGIGVTRPDADGVRGILGGQGGPVEIGRAPGLDYRTAGQRRRWIGGGTWEHEAQEIQQGGDGRIPTQRQATQQTYRQAEFGRNLEDEGPIGADVSGQQGKLAGLHPLLHQAGLQPAQCCTDLGAPVRSLNEPHGVPVRPPLGSLTGRGPRLSRLAGKQAALEAGQGELLGRMFGVLRLVVRKWNCLYTE